MTTADHDGFEELEEKALCFGFHRSVWTVIRWDGHPAQKRIERLDGTKAVDFLALHEEHGLHFIEVKDHRRYSRRKKVPLAVEFAWKVRDTVAGVVAAARQKDGLQDVLLPFAQALLDPSTRVQAVLWEEHALQKKPHGVPHLVREQLRWLTTHVLITNRRLRGLPDVEVRSLPYQAMQ